MTYDLIISCVLQVALKDDLTNQNVIKYYSTSVQNDAGFRRLPVYTYTHPNQGRDIIYLIKIKSASCEPSL